MRTFKFLVLFVFFSLTTPSHGGDVVDRIATLLLSLDRWDLRSDPVVMKDVVENEFYLKTFPEAITLIQPYLDAPQPLSDFFQQIKQAIRSRHPAIIEVLTQTEEIGILPTRLSKEQTALTIRTLHNMVVLEALVQEMTRDVIFMKAVQDHYLKLRYEILPKESSLWQKYEATGGVFEVAKLLTMDQVFEQYLLFRTKGPLDAGDLKAKDFGLRLNISEATIADTLQCNFSNAYVGRTLLSSRIQSLFKCTEGPLYQHFESDSWSPLYETWNLAFVLGNLENLHIVLPKLLIPSVIDATPDEYLFYRGISLWVTINLYLLHNMHHKEPVILPEEIKIPLVEIWGEVNTRYAEDMGGATWPSVMPYLARLVWDAFWRRF